MKLLNELIEALSDMHPNVTNALIKTKVLLYQLGRKDLAEWVNHELGGYPEEMPVPAYRVVHAVVHGTVSNMVQRYSNHPLPTRHLDPEVRRRFENLEMRDSISILEKLAADGDKGFRCPIPLELNGRFGEVLDNGYEVERAWCETGIGQASQMLTQVRSRLLDFLLELSEKVGKEMTEEDVKKLGQAQETASMFNNAIFGDNTTILVGSHGQQTVTNQITRGDFEALSTLLHGHNVQHGEIAQLKLAIEADAESGDVASKQLGPGVKGWMKSMLGKAIDTSWQIEVAIAANLLTDALKAYYGW